MTHPRRFLIRMAAFLAAVAVVLALLSPGLSGAFLANPALNGLIFVVFLVGVALNFRQVLQIRPEIDWLEKFRRGQASLSSEQAPRLLAPLATMLGESRRGDRFTMSAMSMRSVLDGIAARLDEQRELARYFIGLMIFLGLLGTFWGLTQTVSSIGNVIQNLQITGDDFASAFAGLRQGLEAPLAGMGTAFSSSLFGLGGSLILGFLDLQAGRAQNQFYNELEEWLSAQTRLTGGTGIVAEGGDQSVPAYIQALLEQTAESIDNLQRILSRGEESRISANNNIRALTEKLTTLTDQMRAEQSLMLRLAESQLEMKPILARLAEASSQGMDDSTRNHIRNLDASLSRMVDEMSVGRDEVIREMRSEFKLLARTIAAIAEETEPR
ncbi:flagellar motor protein MotA [Telmatospirillum sp. J64-1]|uniref:flagellar motor protein MotA n=1 Tax=Telmatospirillum sp. J64-1 TaxID=2502183 RepID=UPI00115DCEDC|nr:flagellar motor protein MotA [Telmatospirillum sp. J64-1]